MPTSYAKGYALEREIVNAFRAEGYNAVRSAGSHSPRDVFVWLERTDQPVSQYCINVLTKLKFHRVQGTLMWVREGKKYRDTIHKYDFHTTEPWVESIFTFQCKRKKF